MLGDLTIMQIQKITHMGASERVIFCQFLSQLELQVQHTCVFRKTIIDKCIALAKCEFSFLDHTAKLQINSAMP